LWASAGGLSKLRPLSRKDAQKALSGFNCAKVPANLFDLLLNCLQDLRGHAGRGLAHSHLHRPSLGHGGKLPRPKVPRIPGLNRYVAIASIMLQTFCGPASAEPIQRRFNLGTARCKLTDAIEALQRGENVDQLKKGDVVRANSGGPTMRVEKVANDMKGKLTAWCVWFEGRQHSGAFDPGALEIVTSDFNENSAPAKAS